MSQNEIAISVQGLFLLQSIFDYLKITTKGRLKIN